MTERKSAGDVETMVALERALESMVDRIGVRNLLYALVHICKEKASRVGSNWQDKILAKEWENRAVRVMNLADAMPRGREEDYR